MPYISDHHADMLKGGMIKCGDVAMSECGSVRVGRIMGSIKRGMVRGDKRATSGPWASLVRKVLREVKVEVEC